MSVDPNLVRWIFASVSFTLKAVAIGNNIPVIVEGVDDETDTFTDATDTVEIRISGPYTKELSGEYHIWVDINILLKSRFDGATKNRHTILTNAGLFHEAMDQPLMVYKYGSEEGVDDNSYVGCLTPRSGKNDTIRVIHFGKVDPTDKVKQSAVDARYEMYLPKDSA